MTRKEYRKERRRETGSVRYEYTCDFEDQRLLRQKQRARELRSTAWWRQKIAAGICHYCGNHFPSTELTMDHKIPLARGGESEKNNLVPACKECNNKKKYLLPVEWDEYLDNIKKKLI